MEYLLKKQHNFSVTLLRKTSQVHFYNTNVKVINYNKKILMDLSKAIDTINHDLVIAKLEAYWFSNSALLCLVT